MDGNWGFETLGSGLENYKGNVSLKEEGKRLHGTKMGTALHRIPHRLCQKSSVTEGSFKMASLYFFDACLEDKLMSLIARPDKSGLFVQHNTRQSAGRVNATKRLAQPSEPGFRPSLFPPVSISFIFSFIQRQEAIDCLRITGLIEIKRFRTWSDHIKGIWFSCETLIISGISFVGEKQDSDVVSLHVGVENRLAMTWLQYIQSTCPQVIQCFAF